MRGETAEQRHVLTSCCQLEPKLIAAVKVRDLSAYSGQLRAQMLAECEVHLAAEREMWREELEVQAQRLVQEYASQVAEADLQTCSERRKQLSEKQVCLQSQVLCGEKKQALEWVRKE